MAMLLHPEASRGPRLAPIVVSLIGHMSVLAMVAFGPPPAPKQESLYRREIAPHEKKLVWYRFSKKLPEVSPPRQKAAALRPRAEVKHPDQTIVSRSPKSDPAKQTILTPGPELKIQQDLAAPNLMAFEAPKPPDPVPQPKLFMPPPEIARTLEQPELEQGPALTVTAPQDLSPMMLRAVGRRASTGSVTVLGDLAQATTPWATRSWRESLAHLGHPDAAVEELLAGFRVPGAVIDFAARLLPQIAPALKPPHSVRRHRGELEVRSTGQVADELVNAIAQTIGNEGTVGVIVADAAVPGVRKLLERHQMDYDLLGEDPQLFDLRGELGSSDSLATPMLRPIVVPASLAKGLEFDHVVLLEPVEIVDGEPDQVTGLRRLYVCLTRAVTSLIVVHAAELPGALAA